jgi:hypothetical protein
MAKVHPGRYTAEIDGDFVVFLIGMRFNRLWKVHKWWPVFVAMPRMLRALANDPELGLLGTRFARSGRTITAVQYWRSFDHLEYFARAADAPHLEPWRAFNRKVGSNGDVGIYHETFRIAPGAFECVYGNMPVMGLAAAGRHIAVSARLDAARQRMNGDSTRAQ